MVDGLSHKCRRSGLPEAVGRCVGGKWDVKLEPIIGTCQREIFGAANPAVIRPSLSLRASLETDRSGCCWLCPDDSCGEGRVFPPYLAPPGNSISVNSASSSLSFVLLDSAPDIRCSQEAANLETSFLRRMSENPSSTVSKKIQGADVIAVEWHPQCSGIFTWPLKIFARRLCGEAASIRINSVCLVRMNSPRRVNRIILLLHAFISLPLIFLDTLFTCRRRSF